MKLKKVIGIFLLLFGLILIGLQISLTGNVISNGETNFKSILGFAFIFGGMIFLTRNSLVNKTEKARVGNVVRFKPCKRVNLSRVRQEIEKVKGIAQNPQSPEKKTYYFHKVPVAGETFLVADAKILNRVTNQSGRGDLRYLFDRKTNEYKGLAKEKDDGRYDQVA